ncbi:MAG: flagellar hook-length control protein FliK [Lachnospiraceae bacterium]|nr:flagellar hook-length control protein FliK [Lachnospiraceae bacterium]
MTGVGNVTSAKSAVLDLLATSAVNASAQSADFGQVMQQSIGSKDMQSSRPADGGKVAVDDKAVSQPVNPTQDVPDEKVQTAKDSSGLTKDSSPETFEEAVKELVKDVLNIDDEELESLLAQLGLLPLDLLKPENMQQLVLAVNGGNDITDLLMDETMMSDFQALMQGMEDMNLSAEMIPTELADVLQQMEQVAPEEIVLDAEALDEVQEEGIPVIIERDPKAVNQQAVTQDAEVSDEQGIVENQNEPVQKVEASSQSDQTENGSTQQESLPQQTELHEQPVHAENPFNQFVTEAVKEPQATQPVNQTMQIIEQIVQQIRISVQVTTTTMEMQLNPESLGKVLLTLSMKEGMMTANFTVQTEEARMAIESQMYTLRETLEQKEFKVDAVEVTVSDFSFTRSGGEDGDSKNMEQGDGRSRRFRFEENEEDDEVTASEEAERVRRNVMRDNGSSIDFTA